MQAPIYIGFMDEMRKIAASLTTPQLVAQEAKGLKRGWDASRRTKSIMRLTGRDNRPAFRARQAAMKDGNATVPGFRPRHNPLTEGETAVKPMPNMKPSQGRSQTIQGLATRGGAAIGAGVAGAGVEHHIMAKKEAPNARSITPSVQ